MSTPCPAFWKRYLSLNNILKILNENLVLRDAGYPNALLLSGLRPMTGDLDLAANDLLTTNFRLEEYDSEYMYLKNRANTAAKSFILNRLQTAIIHASATLQLSPLYNVHSTHTINLRSATGSAFINHIHAVGGRAELNRMEWIHFLERSSDPSEPAEGEVIIWMSDGTGKGDDGDILIASKAGGATKWGTLFDHSAGAAW